MSPTSRAFAIKEVHPDLHQINLNDLVRIVAIDLIATKNGDRNSLDAGRAPRSSATRQCSIHYPAESCLDGSSGQSVPTA